jgi:transaldolase
LKTVVDVQKTVGSASALIALSERGCVPYLDYLDRDLIASGGLRRLIAEDGIWGVTTNPVIFARAIRERHGYDADIARLASQGQAGDDLLLRLMVDDVRAAADDLAGVYRASRRQYGYVSLEVLPELSRDIDRTIAMALDLFGTVDRPNVLIKVPATREGVVAVEELIAQGVNVNVTTIFDLATYEDVFQAWLRGQNRGGSFGVASVASFFVSRIDASIDAIIERRIATGVLRASFTEFLGVAALATARLVYERYCELSRSPEVQRILERGGLPQRILWGSTATRNPAYRDVKYVEGLAYRDTIATIPMATIEAFRDHGVVDLTMPLDKAQLVAEVLADAEIDMTAVSDELLGIVLEVFGEAIVELRAVITSKIERVAG